MDSLQIVNLLILAGGLLVLFGVVSSLLARRFGVPLLLVFLVLGMLAGEDGPGGIVYNDYHLTYLIGSLALSVILFDGGLRTKLATFRGVVAPSLLLATVGVAITAAVTGLGAVLVVDGMSLWEGMLLGAIVASTDAAAVFFILRTGGLRLQPRVGSVLEIESGTNDPIAVFLTVMLTELLVAPEHGGWVQLLQSVAEQGAIGAALGIGAGFAMAVLLNRIDMPAGLHPLFIVTSVVLTYAAVSLLGGSGLLAVYLAGLVMANRPVRAYPSIVGFHDAATWLCQIVMFLVLGLLVTPTTLITYIVPGLAIAFVLAFVARPLAVWLCLTPFGFSAREKTFVSWVGLRGAVSIFLAAIPTLAGVPYAAVFFNVAFFVVLLSLLCQGSTIALVARRLGVALRRTTPSVHRVELDIPGQIEQELVGYPVGADSLVLGLSRFPPWARSIMVVRDRQVMEPTVAGPLQAGDYVYLLAPPERLPRLDRIFAESPDILRRQEVPEGELPINGDAAMASLATAYDLALADSDAALTVADFLAARLRHPPIPGARVSAGHAVLVVRTVADGKVALAGLQFSEMINALAATVLEPTSPPSAPAFRARLRALRARIRRKLRRGR